MWHRTRYTMVLWGYPPHDAVTVLPSVIDLANAVAGQDLTWHIESQEDCPIPASREEWIQLAERRKNREHGVLDLFLYSLGGIVVGLSLDPPAYVRDFDVLTIGFDSKHIEGVRPIFPFHKLRDLFTRTVGLFRPFWGAVWDREVSITDEANRIRLTVDGTKVPYRVDWLNYFGAAMVERMGGQQKLLIAPAYEVTPMRDPAGVLLILQEEVLDFHNSHHRQRLRAINEYLELGRLHTLYRRDR